MPTRRQFLSALGLVAIGVTAPMRIAVASASPRTRLTHGTRQLPSVLTDHRVHAHTRLPPCSRWGLDTPAFTNAGAHFAEQGASVMIRHFKTGDEDPWWPSALPLGDDGLPLLDRDRTNGNCGQFVPKGRNVAQELIDEAHGQGMKIVAYYWHMTEATIEAMHPDWVCKWPDGTPIEHRARGVFLDITGPYGELTLTRLTELAEMGVDGFYFDGEHLPLGGTWGSPLAAAWEAETNRPAPTGGWTPAAPAFDLADPDYRAYLAFKAGRIEDTLAHWQDQIHAVNSDIVVIVSDPLQSALTDPRTTSRLASITDSTKHEYDFSNVRNLNVFRDNPDLPQPPEDVQRSLGWAVIRDSADGRPPHVWTGALPNADHTRGFVAHLAAHGCIANMNVYEGSLIGEDSEDYTPRDANEAAFAMGDMISPHLAGIRPLRWAACHFSESSRNARGGDLRRAWEEVLWPLTGAYKVLSDDGVPVGVVTDQQLEDGGLDGYQLLVLPNADELSPAQQASVDTFATAGGVVITMDSLWPWAVPDGLPDAEAAFRAAVQPHLSDALVRVTQRPANSYAVPHTRDDAGLAITVTNDLSWVQTRADQVPPGEENPPAPPADGAEARWHRRFGSAAQEAITGTDLEVELVDGWHVATLPSFEYLAIVVVIVAFDDVKAVLEEYRAAGIVDERHYPRLNTYVTTAERLADSRLSGPARRILDRFADDITRISDEQARTELTSMIGALKEQV